MSLDSEVVGKVAAAMRKWLILKANIMNVDIKKKEEEDEVKRKKRIRER